MRTKEQIENERYFGLQKFDKIEDAFYVMSGEWGANCEGISQGQLYILQDEDFKKLMLERAIFRCIEYKLGFIDEGMYERSLWLENWSNDYLMDFDFFLYSKVGGCFYTCRMSFKDDAVDEWNKRQWGYYEELFDLYDIYSIVEDAQYVVDCYFEENKLEDWCKAMLENPNSDDKYYVFQDIAEVVYDEENNMTFIESKIGKTIHFG